MIRTADSPSNNAEENGTVLEVQYGCMQKPWQKGLRACVISLRGGKGETYVRNEPFGIDALECGARPPHSKVYGSGGAGLSVPRSRLNTDDGSHAGIASSLAALIPITSITAATVRGPLQFQSGRTTSVGWW